MSIMSFCTKCGAQIPDGSAFCTSCGTPVGVLNQTSAVESASSMQPAVNSMPAYTSTSIKYSIEGEPLPVVICTLNPGETIITEKGAMAWMSPNMVMETTSNGGFGKMVGRAFSGESMFQNRYTAQGGEGTIAFASSFPGSIRAFEITPSQGIIAQKKAFLAASSTVELSVFFQKRLGAGFFGGEGFIMQKLSGQGTAFLEFDGYIKEYDLQAGQSMVIDTGYLAAMSESCTINIQSVPGLKNMVFGGEGIFNTVITGPGHIWLQTMPVSQVAGALMPFMSTNK